MCHRNLSKHLGLSWAFPFPVYSPSAQCLPKYWDLLPAPCWGLELRSRIGPGSRDPIYCLGCLEGPFGKVWIDSYSRTQHSRKLESITGFLLPRQQRIGKETFPVSIHRVLELIREHCWLWANPPRSHRIQIWFSLSEADSNSFDPPGICPPGPGISLAQIFSGGILVRDPDGHCSLQKERQKNYKVDGFLSILGAAVMAFPISLLAFW